MGILDTDIKNPRFWITMILLGLVATSLLAVVAMVVWAAYTKFALNEALIALVSTVTGGILTEMAHLADSYIKEGAEADALQIANKK
jgi:hypothetical protein